LVKIRLKRMGTTKRPFYRLVVADSRSPRDGRFIEAVGYYDPLPQPATVKIDAERVQEWLRRGARPSDSARDLLVAQGILAGNPRREHAVAVADAADEVPAAVAAAAPGGQEGEAVLEAEPTPVRHATSEPADAVSAPDAETVSEDE